MKNFGEVACLWVAVGSVMLPVTSEAKSGNEQAARGLDIVTPSWQLLQDDPPYNRLWAVVIGINDYRDFPPLQHAVNDARSVSTALLEWGFPQDNIITLYDKEATRDNILSIFPEKLRDLSGAKDGVVFFFAGHGETLRSEGRSFGYLIPVDAQRGAPATYLSMDLLKVSSERLLAKHVLFIMDSCYSGFALARSAGWRGGDTEFLRKIAAKPARQVITGGGSGEMVFEVGGHGVFTEKLLLALEGPADLNIDGVITGSELGHYLRERVSQASGHEQTPLYGTLSGEGEFLFVGRSFDPARVKERELERVSMQRYEAHYATALMSLRKEHWAKAEQELRVALKNRPGDIWAQEKLDFIKERTSLNKEVRDRLGKVMVLVYQGSFVMGANDGYADERPRRQVFVPAFYIDQDEVTNREYEEFLKFVDTGGVSNYAHRDAPLGLDYYPRSWVGRSKSLNKDLPVTGVTWYAAYAFANWLGKRLPTEAEWEKAIRGVDGRQLPWGNRWQAGAANLGFDSEGGEVSTSDAFPMDSSSVGARALAGNVSEWVFAADNGYERRRTPSDRAGILFRPVRGGSFRTQSPHRFRASARRFLHPATASDSVGFRLVMDVDK